MVEYSHSRYAVRMGPIPHLVEVNAYSHCKFPSGYHPRGAEVCSLALADFGWLGWQVSVEFRTKYY